MSEKQRFNKDIQNRQIAEKRRERWMSRKILTEILENIRLQRDDANWILYQVGNYVKKCEMPDGETCFIFDKFHKGGISCIKN